MITVKTPKGKMTGSWDADDTPLKDAGYQLWFYASDSNSYSDDKTWLNPNKTKLSLKKGESVTVKVTIENGGDNTFWYDYSMSINADDDFELKANVDSLNVITFEIKQKNIHSGVVYLWMQVAKSESDFNNQKYQNVLAIPIYQK